MAKGGRRDFGAIVVAVALATTLVALAAWITPVSRALHLDALSAATAVRAALLPAALVLAAALMARARDVVASVRKTRGHGGQPRSDPN
jgi:hypothetical protein